MDNILRNRIQHSRVLVGTLVSINSCELVEALSLAGMDWLFFDLEHGSMALGDVQRMIQAVRPPCLSFVRIEEPQSVYVKKALDTDCDGIIVPQVNSATIAKRIVEAGKYSPIGERSVGLSRSTSYGMNLSNAVENQNSEKSIIVQIEHIQAVENCEEILMVPGIDGVFIGPYDLSSSMGLIGDVQSVAVQKAIDSVVACAKTKGLPVGSFIGGDGVLEKEVKRGVQFIAVGSDLLRVTASCRTTLDIRSKQG